MKKPLKDMALAHRDRSILPENARKVIPANATYIPALDLWVSDELAFPDLCYTKAKEYLKERGTRMLTPAEWWVYHEYCLQNNTCGCTANEEYLDAVVDKRSIMIAPELCGLKWSKGRLYRDIVPRKGGFFGSSDLHESGIPRQVKNDKSLPYWFSRTDLELRVVTVHLGCNGICLNATIPTNFQNTKYTGVRECYFLLK